MKTATMFGWVALSLLVSISGCKKGDAPAGAGSAAPGSSGAPTGAHVTGPAAMVADRKADIKFLKFNGAGKKRRADFSITNHTGKDAKSMQSWIYYYDAKGKLLDTYPHSFGTDVLKDGASVEKELGQEGDKIPAATHTIEGEITRIELGDGTVWYNENLLMQSNRPVGGATSAQLKDETGEKVVGSYTGQKRVKAIFSMTNTATKDVKYASCNVFYYDDAGKKLDSYSDSFSDTLRPNESLQKELGMEVAKIPSGATSIEIGCGDIEFADGTKFVNHNLTAYDRPKGG